MRYKVTNAAARRRIFLPLWKEKSSNAFWNLEKKKNFLSPKSYRKVNLQVHLQRSKKWLIFINKKKRIKKIFLYLFSQVRNYHGFNPKVINNPICYSETFLFSTLFRNRWGLGSNFHFLLCNSFLVLLYQLFRLSIPSNYILVFIKLKHVWKFVDFAIVS